MKRIVFIYEFIKYKKSALSMKCSIKEALRRMQPTSFSASFLNRLLFIGSYDEVLLQSAQDLQPKHLVNFLLRLR